MRQAHQRSYGLCAALVAALTAGTPIFLSGCTAVVDDGGGGNGGSPCSGAAAVETEDAYFVAGASGDDANLGGKADPLASIQAAIDMAAESGGGDVYVAGGVYNGSIALRSNVNVWGGYDGET